VSTAQHDATGLTHKKHTFRYLPRQAIIKDKLAVIEIVCVGIKGER